MMLPSMMEGVIPAN